MSQAQAESRAREAWLSLTDEQRDALRLLLDPYMTHVVSGG